MNKKYLIIGGIVALIGLIICGGLIALFAGGIFAATQPLATTGDNFMDALKTSNYSQAYTLCSPSLQQELGSAEGLQTMIAENKRQPTSWSWSNRSINNNDGSLSGSVTFANGQTGNVELALTYSSNQWKIAGFNLTEK